MTIDKAYALKFIETKQDVVKLKGLIANAKRIGLTDVEDVLSTTFGKLFMLSKKR